MEIDPAASLGPDGWLASFGTVDYAGGLVVEIVSGSSALALALVLGLRIGFKSEAMRPPMPFVLLGVGLLWFGWFGFNAGSALTADGKAGVVCSFAVGWKFKAGRSPLARDQTIPSLVPTNARVAGDCGELDTRLQRDVDRISFPREGD